jgi:hypothetical protein
VSLEIRRQLSKPARGAPRYTARELPRQLRGLEGLGPLEGVDMVGSAAGHLMTTPDHQLGDELLGGLIWKDLKSTPARSRVRKVGDERSSAKIAGS